MQVTSKAPSQKPRMLLPILSFNTDIWRGRVVAVGNGRHRLQPIFTGQASVVFQEILGSVVALICLDSSLSYFRFPGFASP
ncbi:hypothetical protein AAHC03_01794 [Spirometra sp. Aus1]